MFNHEAILKNIQWTFSLILRGWK